MAKNKKLQLEFTPLLSLAVMTMFALMIPLYTSSKSWNQPRNSMAAEEMKKTNQVVEPTPTPVGDY